MARLPRIEEERKPGFLDAADTGPGNLHGEVKVLHFDARGRKDKAKRRFGDSGFRLAASLKERSKHPPNGPQNENPHPGREDGVPPS